MNLQELIKQPEKTLLDVRTVNEFNQHHIPGAVNIPLSDLRSRLDEIKEMQKPLIVHCLSGGRSGAAVSMLQAEGFEEVYNAGGINMVEMMLLE